MSKLTLRAVVFDVDGVLFDTERLMHTVWVALSEELGWPQAGADYLEYVGNNRSTIFAKMEALYGPAFPKEDFMHSCSQRLQARVEQEGVPLKPGVRELLSFLTQRQIPIALATSTSLERTRRRMELAGLDGYFKAMITGDRVTHGKPHPQIYQLACQALDTDPEHTLAVEDSRNGILSATAAGLPTVMIPDMIPPTPELDDLLYRRFPSLVDLQAHLEDIL